MDSIHFFYCHKLDENGIKGREKSHTQRMENKVQNSEELTKAKDLNVAQTAENRVSISAREAVEYRDYKRQKKRAEILSAISRSEGVLTDLEDAGRISDRAARLRQAAVCVTPSRLGTATEFFTRRLVTADCIIGGTGETLAKVKAYEAKTAVKLRAKELTLVLSPYQVSHCRYAEIRKEMRRVRRVARKAKWKVWVDKTHPYANLARIARMCGELGFSFFCVPYFEGCERLKMELSSGCQLQVSEVETLEEFRRLTNAGVGRIVTEKGWDIYCEWMREVEKIDFPERVKQDSEQTQTPMQAMEQTVKKNTEQVQGKAPEKVLLLPPVPRQEPLSPTTPGIVNSETNYRCRLEGTQLKFF